MDEKTLKGLFNIKTGYFYKEVPCSMKVGSIILIHLRILQIHGR